MPHSSQVLIESAAALLKPHTTSAGRLFGDVGAVLVSGSGKVFEGVCVDTPSWGLCAERSAIAAMITAGEYRIVGYQPNGEGEPRYLIKSEVEKHRRTALESELDPPAAT